MSANPHGFIFNHTMLRVKDPSASLAFYCDTLGMSLLRKRDMESGQFTLYFLGFVDSESDIPEDDEGAAAFVAQRAGVLELTHNWGTEDEEGDVYHDGNSEPRGFGHIALSVPDVEAACARFDDAGVTFQKRPDEGNMKGIAFIKDPDGYWVEIVSNRR